ncbi:MAG: hypothetical protein IJ065_14950 [Eubacterium sp.]|nr:hypothetical protein [Eubacterium sp.]
MNAIFINPELKQIKEKHFEMDWETILGIAASLSIALLLNLILPNSLGTFKPVVAIVPIFPILLLSVKEFYGLKSFRLVSALIRTEINNKPLVYESEVWKKVNEFNVRGREKKLSKIEVKNKKHSAGYSRRKTKR